MTKIKPEQGFTLIELLVVIVITGVLAAISYPSLLSQANKAKQSESKQYTGTLNRSQQAYYLERNQFASDLTSLANPVPESTENYDYTFSTVGTESTNVISYGTSKAVALKSYAGMVAISIVTEGSDATTTAVLCESNTPGAEKSPDPAPPADGSNEQPTCAAGSSRL